MKVVFTICIAFTGLMLNSCGKKNSELIIGRWKIEDATLPQPDLSQHSPEERAVIKKNIEVQNNLMLTTGYFGFDKNFTSYYEEDQEQTPGKWRLSDDENKLYVKDKMSTSEEVFTIKQLTNNLLEIESEIDGQLTRFVMKKELK